MSDGIECLKKAHAPFEKRLNLQEFITRVNFLRNKWNFVRASFLYKQALKCKECESNVAMVLLCSCAETIKVAGEDARPTTNFKKFYMNYCPLNLRNPPIEYYPNAKPPRQRARLLVLSKLMIQNGKILKLSLCLFKS